MYFAKSAPVVLTLLALSLPAAAKSWSGCTSTTCQNVLVEQLWLQENGEVYVLTDGDEHGLSCNTVSSNLVIPAGHALRRELLASLLTAQLAGRPVTFKTTGSGTCYVRSVKTRP